MSFLKMFELNSDRFLLLMSKYIIPIMLVFTFIFSIPVSVKSEIQETQTEGGAQLVRSLESLRDLDNGVLALCGGMCSCATCHCYIEESWASKLGEREDDEQELLEDLDSYKENQSRLSCQVEFSEEMDGMKVEIAPDE